MMCAPHFVLGMLPGMQTMSLFVQRFGDDDDHTTIAITITITIIVTIIISCSGCCLACKECSCLCRLTSLGEARRVSAYVSSFFQRLFYFSMGMFLWAPPYQTKDRLSHLFLTDCKHSFICKGKYVETICCT